MLTWDNCKYATPLIFFNVYRIFFGFRAFYPLFIQIFAVILHRNQMRHESSEMASLTKVSSRVRDCSAPHLLLSPFEHSSLGAPTETHCTLIARSSCCHRTHVREYPLCGVPLALRAVPEPAQFHLRCARSRAWVVPLALRALQ